jgi:transcription elongation factor/antiterminator RfaH
MKRWYVVNVLPNQEVRADLNLRQQGFESWLPRVRRARRHARRVDTVLAPFFPGYLFVRLDRAVDHWRSINGTFGVRRLLCQDDRPLVVPNGLVETLQGTVDEDGLLIVPTDQLRIGDQVRLLSGPFADSVGTLVRLAGKERVGLLLNLLGREVETLISRRMIAPAG